MDHLPRIERSAAAAFRGSSQDAIADDAVSPASLYVPLQAQGLVWVAQDAQDPPDAEGPSGFAACEAFDGALHLWELAVRRERQGQGVGRALIRAVTDAARARGCAAVTLTTFREIAWNAPFYARLGFRELAAHELDGRLAEVLSREAAKGLDVAARCAMRLEVQG